MSLPVQKTLLNGHGLTERECIKLLKDGLNKSASCAREMAALLEAPLWATTAEHLDNMRDGAQKLAQMRSMTKMEVEQGFKLKINSGTAH